MKLEQKVERVVSLLAMAKRQYSPVVFASSFGAEDMLLTDLIAQHHPEIEIFTLDTGRLPEETHALIKRTAARYGVRVRVYCPDTRALEAHILAHGVNAFYESVALRKACCAVRKVEPLQRALAGKRAWITGLRREQSSTREAAMESEFDPTHGLHKFNPLVDWALDEVWEYLHRFGVPYNDLHDRGYPSIGCAPCSRSVSEGENIRAGRWWWESPDTKECGCHAR